MEYVSKKITKVAIEKGFIKHYKKNYCECKNITWQELIEWVFKEIEIKNDFAIPLEKCVNYLEFWYNTLIPELIGKENCEICDNGKHFTHAGDKCNFCHRISIEDKQTNEFVLEGFIGMLINWFEKNNYEICLRNDEEELVKEYWLNIKWNLSSCGTYYKNSIKIGDRFTKQQARHEGILKCFELMKGE